MVVWSCGCVVAVWLCVVVWLCGFVVVWFCGSVIVWWWLCSCGCVVVVV